MFVFRFLKIGCVKVRLPYGLQYRACSLAGGVAASHRREFAAPADSSKKSSERVLGQLAAAIQLEPGQRQSPPPSSPARGVAALRLAVRRGRASPLPPRRRRGPPPRRRRSPPRRPSAAASSRPSAAASSRPSAAARRCGVVAALRLFFPGVIKAFLKCPVPASLFLSLAFLLAASSAHSLAHSAFVACSPPFSLPLSSPSLPLPLSMFIAPRPPRPPTYSRFPRIQLAALPPPPSPRPSSPAFARPPPNVLLQAGRLSELKLVDKSGQGSHDNVQAQQWVTNQRCGCG